jgi:hypothetical protein
MRWHARHLLGLLLFTVFAAATARRSTVSIVVPPPRSTVVLHGAKSGADSLVAGDLHDVGHVNAAARELRRYLYLVTSEIPELLSRLPQPHERRRLTIILGVADDRQSTDVLVAALEEFQPLHAAGPHDHRLHSSWGTIDDENTLAVGLQGMSALATKYAVFSMLEEVGVGFRLHGQDAVPRLSVSAVIDRLGALRNKTMTPGAITTRGIQPFHDFSEGPDQWNEDDYKVHFEQLTKLKMNFIGLHTYPNREPTVWTGVSSQFDPSTGDVTTSYSSSYMTTRGGGDWGGVAFNSTDEYTFGSRQLMAGGKITSKCFGSDLLDGHGSCLGTSGSSSDATMSNWNELFNTVGKMLARVFRFGRSVGVQTCVGTEAPLAKPSSCANASATQLYQGIFERIIALGLPLDYYWIWTPEGWGARNKKVPVTDPLVAEMLDDFLAADAALKAVAHTGANFSLATCGWTLGPMSNRS